MSLVGMRLAFLHSLRIPVADDFDVPIAPAAVIVALKMVAYLDRPAERTKDLGDIGHTLEHYIAADDERHYSSEVLECELDFEDVGAFLLGRDVAAIIREDEKAVVEAFIARVRSDDHGAAQARVLQLGPRSWRGNSKVLASRLDAFEQGLGSHTGESVK